MSVFAAVGMGSGKELVEPVFPAVEREHGDRKAQAAESGGADRDQQGGGGLPACALPQS